MDKIKQRIAIAEACGWIRYNKEGLDAYHPKHDGEFPDYLNDLNDMFDAFKYIGRHWEIRQIEDGYVCKIEFGPKNKDILVVGLDLLPVMAEAFLKTLNLWEE